MGWNGSDLVNELAALLGDQSENFKDRVEGWLNDAEREICKEHDWSFLRLKGKKIMVLDQEEQSLLISAPSVPNLAVANGGSLAESTVYKVKVSFYDPDSKNEITSASASISTTASDKTINLTNIPLCTESFFVQRKVYLKKGSGKYYYVGTIADNTTTTYSISADTTSKIQPTEFEYIRQLDGDPFYESTVGKLQYYPVQQIRTYVDGVIESGQPEMWSDLGTAKILLYPKPNATTALSFYYYKIPRGIYRDEDSVPTLPISLKEVLEAYVEYKGCKYRDRAGTVEKYNVYLQKLKQSIDSVGSSTTKTVAKVRDMVGRSNGWSYN